MINKKYLILIAGIIWLIASFFILKIGVPIFIALLKHSIINVLSYIIASLVIFYLFYFKIFSKLVLKHTNRIKNNNSKKMKFWQFFDLKSYLIMIFMMSFGILGRKLNLFPTIFIAIFYPGLGFALFLAGINFIFNFFNFTKK